MPRLFPSRRALRIFLAGVAGSLLILGALYIVGNSSLASTSLGNRGGLILVRVFLLANPLLTLAAWLGPRAPSGIGQMIFTAVYLILFVGWWWSIAVVIDRLVRRRRQLTGEQPGRSVTD